LSNYCSDIELLIIIHYELFVKKDIQGLILFLGGWLGFRELVVLFVVAFLTEHDQIVIVPDEVEVRFREGMDRDDVVDLLPTYLVARLTYIAVRPYLREGIWEIEPLPKLYLFLGIPSIDSVFDRIEGELGVMPFLVLIQLHAPYRGPVITAIPPAGMFLTMTERMGVVAFLREQPRPADPTDPLKDPGPFMSPIRILVIPDVKVGRLDGARLFDVLHDMLPSAPTMGPLADAVVGPQRGREEGMADHAPLEDRQSFRTLIPRPRSSFAILSLILCSNLVS
jgi:hypothetical protein